MSTLSAALEARDKATKGPWAWFANVRTKEVYLATPDRGRIFVMDFVRYGMSLAAPRFQVRDESGNGIMYRVDELSKPDHNGSIEINHPDALQIAAAPDALDWIAKALPILRYIHENDCEIGWMREDAVTQLIAQAEGQKEGE